jgi:hypothetical protein
LRAKARFVLGEMERRTAAPGVGWEQTTAAQVYAVYDIHHVLADEIVGRGAARTGLTWRFCRPPVDVLDYEMVCAASRRRSCWTEPRPAGWRRSM